MAKNKQSNLIASCKILNVGFIKQIMNGEGYSVVYLIWLITSHFYQISFHYAFALN